MLKQYLYIHGCCQNNLKNISLKIPKHNLIAITGISGSGKSSLAFDTIFAEGQHKYMECLSFQSRKWIKQLPKAEVKLIEGLSPTLAINQKTGRLSPKSTVATHTNIYDFLSILYANLSKQYSPQTGKELIRHSPQQIIEIILKEYPTNSRIQIIAPVDLEKENINQAIVRLQKQGYIRFRINDKEFNPANDILDKEHAKSIDVVIDRLIMKENIRERLSDSIETALRLSKGIVKIQENINGSIRFFTEIYVCPENRFSLSSSNSCSF